MVRKNSSKTDSKEPRKKKPAEPIVSSAMDEENAQLVEELHVALEELRLQNEELSVERSKNEAQKRRYQELFEFAPDGYIVTDPGGRIEESNKIADAMLNVNSPFLTGKPLSVYVASKHRPQFYSLLKDLQTKDNLDIETMEFELQGRDSKPFHGSVRVGPIRNESGVLTGLRWLIRDMSTQREQEEVLAENIRSLASSNLELEQWSTATAHDLQEPVRVIATYADSLKETLANKLTPEEEMHLKFISTSSHKALSLIRDLLVYNTIQGKQVEFENVELNKPLMEAVEFLKPQLRATSGNIDCGQLPSVLGRESQLVQLFQNLLGNALKFRGKAAPRVRVSATLKKEFWQIAITDNGIGFDKKYSERIFVMFERLHPESKFKGNGIGLALCRKIVENHGGQIWAESGDGKGATFFFTLRKSDEADL